MPRTVKNIKGIRVGRLRVQEYLNNGKWRCLCDCGNVADVSTGNLVHFRTKSCGCYSKDFPSHAKHGLSKTRLYDIWQHIKARCNRTTDIGYSLYGARGIKICEEWAKFEAFYDWAIENGYDDSLTIDRIDVNGNYEPSNCRWTSDIVQQNNRRNNRRLSCRGKTMTVSEWCRELNIPPDRVYMRLKHGWDAEEALFTPKMANQFTLYKGESK